MTGKLPAAGVIGWPVKHSLSPLIHGLWLKAAGIEGLYTTYETPKAAFAQTVGDLRAGGLRGLNVTVPHKEAALALADRADEAAKAAGAANLLLFHDDGIEARNTDGIGLLAALAKDAPDFEPKDSVVVVFGAGGAARGAAAALKVAGAREIRIVNRTTERAEALAALVGGVARRWDEDEATLLKDATLAVNATTLGLNGENPFWLSFPTPAPKGAAVLDMVYRPLVTTFLQLVIQESDWKAVTGLSMLIEQARPSFEAFFGQTPPKDVDVFQACLDALGEAR